MELSKEFVEKNQLSTEQAAAITAEVGTHVADIKKEWDGLANTNAEKIIEGALNSTVELTGIARNEGEKAADYLKRSNGLFFEGTKNTLQQKQDQLDKLITDGKPSEQAQEQYNELKGKYDTLQQKEATFADWEANDYKTKWEKSSEQLNNQTKDIAFTSVKPAFPETVNEYEAKGKWNEFENNILNKFHIKKVDKEWMAVDKENEYKVVKLSDLVKQDEQLTELLKGRQQTGLNSQVNNIVVEGVPFKVPENATPIQRSQAIRDHLATQNISKTDPRYATEFAKYNGLILQKKAS